MFDKKHICHKYEKDYGLKYTFSYSFSIILAITNMIVRSFIYKIIDLNRFDNLSNRTSSIITTIFITTFINSGILILFTNANLQYSILSFIPIKM